MIVSALRSLWKLTGVIQGTALFQALFTAGLVLAVTIALHAGWYGWSFARYPTIGEDFTCFLLSLAIFHAWFWAGRRNSTPNVTRIIDYVYLSYASIGLLAASDIAIKHYNEFSGSMRRQTVATLALSKSELQPSKDAACVDPSAGKDCSTYEELFHLIDNASVLISNVNYPIQDVKGSIDQIVSFERRFPAIHQALSRYEPTIEDAENDLDRLQDEPFGVERDDAEQLNRYRALGYMLVASALALRITRVTIEWRGWFQQAAAPMQGCRDADLTDAPNDGGEGISVVPAQPAAS